MSGLPEKNKPAFLEAYAKLLMAGFVVRTPFEFETIGREENWPQERFIREGIKVMLDCDGVALLPNWVSSEGATTEYDVAYRLQLPTYPVEEWIRRSERHPDSSAK